MRENLLFIRRAVKPRPIPPAAKRLRGRADGFGRGYKAWTAKQSLCFGSIRRFLLLNILTNNGDGCAAA